MKKLFLCLSLCIIFFLASCSQTPEVLTKDYTHISSELTELMHATKPYSYYPWGNAKVCVTEDSFEIQYPRLEYPMVKVLEDNGKAKIQMYFQMNEEISYKKGNEYKQADLSMSYYVNMGQYN